MDALWHYARGSRRFGPVAIAELKRLAQSGELRPTDTIRQEGTFDWQSASVMPELFAPPETLEKADIVPAVEESILWLDETGADRRSSRADDDRRSDHIDDEGQEDDRLQSDPAQHVLRLLRRAFSVDANALQLTEREKWQFRRTVIQEPAVQRYAVWRKSLLWVVLGPTALASLLHFINLLSMAKHDRDVFSRFGTALQYLQVLSMFALPIASMLAIRDCNRLHSSSRNLLVGAIIAFAVPILVALVPAEHILDAKMSGDAERLGVGMVFGLMFYITLLPTMLSLLPAMSRACIRVKILSPASIAPGWGLFASAPFFMLIGFASFILIYHIVNNFLLLIGVLLWVGAPLFYLTRADLLIRPLSRNKDLKAIGRMHLFVLGTVSVGVMLIIVFLFTSRIGGKYLVGIDKYSSMLRPWDLDLHARWIEFVGRSLFLTVVFVDLLMRMNVSVWSNVRTFCQSEHVAAYDREIDGFAAALKPPKRLYDENDDTD